MRSIFEYQNGLFGCFRAQTHKTKNCTKKPTKKLKQKKNSKRKLINFVVVSSECESKRCAFFVFFFFFCSLPEVLHSSYNALDYKFNILCIISTLASFITFFFRRLHSGDDSYVFFLLGFFFRFKVIRIRHRQWFCQLHQLPFLYILAIVPLLLQRVIPVKETQN